MVYPPQNHLKIPPREDRRTSQTGRDASDAPLTELCLAGSRIRAVIASAQTTLASIATQSVVPPAEIFTVRLAVFEAKRPDVVTTESVVA